MNILLIILFTAAAWMLLFLYLKRRIDRLGRDDAQLTRIRQEVNQLIIELDQTTERNIQLLENKITQLKEISQSSKREIKLLQDQKEEYNAALNKYRELGRREVERVSPHKEAEKPEPIEEEVKTEPQSPRDRVMQRYRMGATVEEISRLEDIPQGEVELIISMNTLGR